MGERNNGVRERIGRERERETRKDREGERKREGSERTGKEIARKTKRE